ncbi:sensor histidine kinase [Larkinella rosea]|uniref:Sensor protein lytS n=1 Tax=Larkinella rosea TaxID=2025312 RepID=A0A3P1BZV7_9BACT|nr:histidine kinase [Larkinella rosea]RRB06617.1 sensor protein lytS [Larkinella rosea]
MNQWARFDRTDVLVVAINFPAVFIANYVIFGNRYVSDMTLFLGSSAVICVLAILLSVSLTLWMKYLRFRYTHLNQFSKRLLYSVFVYVVGTSLMVLSLFGLYHWLDYPYNLNTLPWILMIGFVTNIISAGLHESVYTYNQWLRSEQREYRLKHLHMQQQLDVLKQQVNPHFLFNSLNSLISLIGENPQQAEIFAEELSTVYRYVLRANEENLTELKSELGFVQSYAHLLKTRYGNGLTIDLRIDADAQSYRIPPLTLQLLIENAVKHNIVMADQPLTIRIETIPDGWIQVTNNLQRKPSRVLSNGVGLSNILAKYTMLGQVVPTIQENDGQFTVKLPLLAKISSPIVAGTEPNSTPKPY